MKILFVCTGNTCRSPMAEGYLKSLNLPGIEVLSAGLSVGYSDKVSENAVTVMHEMGIDISNHTPTQLTADIASSADKIICMGLSHMQILKSAGINADISVLGSGISDPYGGDEDMYAVCRNEIIYEIDRIVKNIKIRLFKAGDEIEISEIEKQCFSKPWSADGILSSVKSGTTFIVAEKAFKTVGYISINIILDEGYINNLAVIRENRRNGIAEKLLNYTERFANGKNLSFISLEVRESNSAAIALYLKCGYSKAGLRKNFYFSPQESAIIMTKYLKRD